MTIAMTPVEYIKAHHITQQLKRLGVTDEQLEGLQFTAFNRDCPFDQWSFRWSDGIPMEAMHLFKPYCALKWLVLENPPHSRDKEDALRLVNDVRVADEIAKGSGLIAAQQQRAKAPRGKILGEEITLNQAIEKLVLQPEHCELSAKELWSHFFAMLEGLQLSPEEKRHPTDLQKSAYEYGPEDNRKPITFGRFANIVSAARKRTTSKNNHVSRATVV